VLKDERNCNTKKNPEGTLSPLLLDYGKDDTNQYEDHCPKRIHLTTPLSDVQILNTRWLRQHTKTNLSNTPHNQYSTDHAY